MATEFERQQEAVDFLLLEAWRRLVDAEKAAIAVWPNRSIARHVASISDIVTVLRDRIYTMREV